MEFDRILEPTRAMLAMSPRYSDAHVLREYVGVRNQLSSTGGSPICDTFWDMQTRKIAFENLHPVARSC